ncbi:hypothetical protein [Erysipelothrix aquatica]|uniref:hypothetical protein n=1 Tax=Erysipelothrix aquatica TaxID=2683714 RepID=UPI00135B2258|nr:hypothetical protein [Erysipelothrix aquatica]
MRPETTKSIRILLWFVAFLPIIAFSFLLIAMYTAWDLIMPTPTHQFLTGIIIAGAYILAYCTVAKNKYMNLLGVLLMALWVSYLFIENSHKFPPIKTAPLFVIYFGTILSITCIINHFE